MNFIKTRDEDETANLIWNDSAVQHEKIAELRNYQVRCTSIGIHYTPAKRLEMRVWRRGFWSFFPLMRWTGKCRAETQRAVSTVSLMFKDNLFKVPKPKFKFKVWVWINLLKKAERKLNLTAPLQCLFVFVDFSALAATPDYHFLEYDNTCMREKGLICRSGRDIFVFIHAYILKMCFL